MKQSQFNVVIPDFPAPDEMLIFNTLTDSRVVINRELKEAMEIAETGKQISLGAMEYLRNLQELGIMVDDHVDEDLELEYWFQRFKFDTSVLSITILTTYKCNLKCTYCFQDGINRVASMGQKVCGKTVNWITDKINQTRPETLRITFYGGEPLLNHKALSHLTKDLYHVAEKKDMTIEIGIITNGVLLNREVIESLLPYGLKWIKVTLDGDEKTHNEKRPYKNGKGTYRQILNNLLDIQGLLTISIGGNFDEKSRDGVPRLLDELMGLDFNGDVESINFRPIFSNFRSMVDGIALHKTCTFADANLEDILLLRKEVEERGFATQEGIAIGPCEAAREHTYTIDPTGKIYKCPGFVGLDQFAIGDIDSGELNYINTLFMTATPQNNCKKCLYVPICGGGCRASAYIESGDFLQPTCEKEYFSEVAVELLKKEYQKHN